MPNLADLVEIAESLGSSHVYVAPHRCVKVRNRNAKCSKCVDACAHDAVQVGGNKLSIVAPLCVGCHACTTACPTEALIPIDPQDSELLDSIASATLAAEGKSVFACARMAARHVAEPEKYAQVSCLARMEEGVLLQLAARGIGDIVLVDGVCSTCKYRANIPLIDTVVDTANQLLAAQGSDTRVQRVSSFPESVLAEDAHASYTASRRSFFTQAGSMTRSAAKTAAEKSVEQMLGAQKKVEPTLRERLQMGAGNNLPQFQSDRHMHVLDAMYELGESQVDAIDTRLFGNVSIDTEKCSTCFMCTTFCPTGALKKSEEPLPEGAEGELLEFSVADCVQCRLCADACLKKCITVDTRVSTAELFDFEPRFILLPRPAARKGVIQSMRNSRKK